MNATLTAASTTIDSRVTQDGEGNAFVSVDLPVGIADLLVAHLRANPTPELAAAVDILAGTLHDAYEVVLAEILGCPDLLSGGDTMILTEDAILGSLDDGILSVLLPGQYTARDAAVKGFAAVQDHASARGIDLDDPHLTVNIHPAQWMVLLHCDAADHDFHPQDSDAGTPGAILVTRIDLEMAYANIAA